MLEKNRLAGEFEYLPVPSSATSGHSQCQVRYGTRRRFLFSLLSAFILVSLFCTAYKQSTGPLVWFGRLTEKLYHSGEGYKPVLLPDTNECTAFFNPALRPEFDEVPNVRYHWNASDIRFFLMGSHTTTLTGNFNVVTRAADDDSEDAVLTVEPEYLDPKADVEAIVCAERSYPGQIVFDVFASLSRQTPPKVALHMTLTLPRDKGDEPASDLLFLSLPNFTFNFGDTKDSTLDLVRLYGGDSDFYIESIKSNDLLILNQGEGTISGNFDVSRRLVLKTDYGSISANTSLLDDQVIPQWPAVFEISTLKGSIDARLNLISASGRDGKFQISALAKYQPLNVTIDAAPVDSQIELKALTTGGAASVRLPPTYEGLFNLHSESSRTPEVYFDKTLEDPTGKGRRRSFEMYKEDDTRISGNVSWSGDYHGSVEVGALHAPVYLVL